MQSNAHLSPDYVNNHHGRWSLSGGWRSAVSDQRSAIDERVLKAASCRLFINEPCPPGELTDRLAADDVGVARAARAARNECV